MFENNLVAEYLKKGDPTRPDGIRGGRSLIFLYMDKDIGIDIYLHIYICLCVCEQTRGREAEDVLRGRPDSPREGASFILLYQLVIIFETKL